MNPIQLFGPGSTDLDSVVFEIKTQVTVMSVGLQPGDYISFEIVKVSGDQRPKVCGCKLTPQILASIEGVQELQCPACEELTQRPVRITPQNPLAVLDVPQNTLMRAIYHGEGLDLGTVTVWAVLSNTQDLTDSLRGCPPIYYPDEDQTWVDTGQFRCLADQVTIEYEQVNECGRRRWFPDPTRPQIWVDTGQFRCLADQVGVEFEQSNQCGNRRWTLSLTVTQIWLPAGVHRCTPEGDVELQEINQCGELRWTVCGPVVWTVTGRIRCLADGTSIEQEETNQCGHLRWVPSVDPQVWTDTANIRCLPDDVTIEVEQTNQCGDRRWVDAGYAQEWVDTPYVRCLPDAVTIEIMQTNQCGLTRWVEAGYEQVWTDTANIRCLPDEITIEVEQTNQCGDRRWFTAAYNQVWNETGLERCVDDIIERQEVNQCGLYRWVATAESCATPVAPSVHSVVSIAPVDPAITEGEDACWTVTLNAPVDGANLTIAFALSGLEQDTQSYPAPNLVIPVGNIMGVVCVPTTDDLVDEATLPLCIAALTSPRITSVPAASCIDVEDNDDVDPGDSVHTVLSVVADPASGVEGTEFCWTVTLDAPVAGTDLNVIGVLSGAEQDEHGYANPSGVIPVGMSSVDLCVTTTNDTIGESTLDLCLTVQTSPRITSVPAAECVDVTDDGDSVPPPLMPATLGGPCFIENPNEDFSEYYFTFVPAGDLFDKKLLGFSTFEWLPAGQDPANYEVMVDDTSDPALAQAGDFRGVWLNLGVTRDFRWSVISPGPVGGLVQATVHVRRVGEVVDDHTVVVDPDTFVGVGLACPP